MKLDYSAKDKNWHIYTPDSNNPIAPQKEQISPLALGIAAGIVIVLLLIIFGIYGAYHHLKNNESTPTVVETPQDTAIQTLTIPLELPKQTNS